MSDGTITLDAWGEEFSFRLAIGEFRQLQDAINRPRAELGLPPLGPTELFRSLVALNAWPHEVREVLRLGLIGGGMKGDRALVLIKRHVETDGHYQQSCEMAAAVLGRALYGKPDDPVGKQPAPAEPEPATMDLSGSLNSTASVLQ
jgi:Phage tail tube protein, GTA-gp10